MKQFLRELKRRNVFKVAVAYLAVTFVVLQGARLLIPALVLPEWFYRAVVALVILGFPLALVLGWAYELTPEGMRRAETPVEEGAGNKDIPAFDAEARTDPRITAALITGTFMLAAALLTSPLILDIWPGSSSPTTPTEETPSQRQIQAIHDVSYRIENRDERDSILAKIRTEKDLTRLQTLEVGLSVSEVPRGRYFLVSSFELDALRSDASARTQRSRRSHFEVHKESSGALTLISYMSKQTAGELLLDREEPAEATIAPVPWEEMQSLVQIPVERIEAVGRRRDVPSGDYFDITIVDVVVD